MAGREEQEREMAARLRFMACQIGTHYLQTVPFLISPMMCCKALPACKVLRPAEVALLPCLTPRQFWGWTGGKEGGIITKGDGIEKSFPGQDSQTDGLGQQRKVEWCLHRQGSLTRFSRVRQTYLSFVPTINGLLCVINEAEVAWHCLPVCLRKVVQCYLHCSHFLSGYMTLCSMVSSQAVTYRCFVMQYLVHKVPFGVSGWWGKPSLWCLVPGHVRQNFTRLYQMTGWRVHVVLVS